MTLGTADETGLPWVSPVWFAPVLEDVAAPARLRLYRATAVEHFVHGPGDERTPVELAVR